uniref:RING-type domain-containing protein n=1 Tax=Parascaris equorum TaxID=6256 RepID=A0A914RHC7_PAREQ
LQRLLLTDHHNGATATAVNAYNKLKASYTQSGNYKRKQIQHGKQPKLLPCHHTFCLPCLDNCADVVHRILKCPECRAEHPLPYDGVKSFQTNYTLTGFLDIHLQATDENAAQLEAYIQRYNLERCKICDEKATLELCAHCERRACADCRNTHMEMLKRDLNRMLNQ